MKPFQYRLDGGFWRNFKIQNQSAKCDIGRPPKKHPNENGKYTTRNIRFDRPFALPKKRSIKDAMWKKLCVCVFLFEYACKMSKFSWIFPTYWIPVKRLFDYHWADSQKSVWTTPLSPARHQTPFWSTLFWRIQHTGWSQTIPFRRMRFYTVPTHIKQIQWWKERFRQTLHFVHSQWFEFNQAKCRVGAYDAIQMEKNITKRMKKKTTFQFASIYIVQHIGVWFSLVVFCTISECFRWWHQKVLQVLSEFKSSLDSQMPLFHMILKHLLRLSNPIAFKRYFTCSCLTFSIWSINFEYKTNQKKLFRIEVCCYLMKKKMRSYL